MYANIHHSKLHYRRCVIYNMYGFDEFIEHRRASKSQLRGFIVIHTAVQKPEQVHLAMKAAL